MRFLAIVVAGLVCIIRTRCEHSATDPTDPGRQRRTSDGAAGGNDLGR